MALHRPDLAAVVTNPAKTLEIIRHGFSIMRRIGSSGGVKVRQSERFLQKLVHATLRRCEKVVLRCLLSSRTITITF